ncbi:hypothetical protein IAU59_002473 [Kwoniella sp. CBS 9459]
MPATPARPPHRAVRATPYTRHPPSSQSHKPGSAPTASGTAEMSKAARLPANAEAASSAPDDSAKPDASKKNKKKNKKKRTRSSDASIINPSPLAQSQHHNKRRSESPVKSTQQDSQKLSKSNEQSSQPPFASEETDMVDPFGQRTLSEIFGVGLDTSAPSPSPSSQNPPHPQENGISSSHKRKSADANLTTLDVAPATSSSPEKKKKEKRRREKNRAHEELKAFLRAERERKQGQHLEEGPAASAEVPQDIVKSDTVPPEGDDTTKQADLENALKAQQRALDEEKKRRSNQELARVREEAKKREETLFELQQLKDEVEKWKAEAEKERQAKMDCEKAMEDMVGTLEKQIEDKSSHNQAQAVVIKDHEATKSALKEAVECGVCLMTVDDPHILSCGHMACKGCLMEWFRTAGAYQSVILDPITPETDLSHRVKLCHVCRAIVLRRPARVFFVRQILEPLGLYEHRDAPISSSQLDPWDKIFPIERESYKIYDEIDHVWRCPTCGGEIDDGSCTGCGIVFSDIDDDDFDDLNTESDVVGSILGDGPIIGGFNIGEEEGSDDAVVAIQPRRRDAEERGRRHLLLDDEAEDDLSSDDDESSASSENELRPGRHRQRPAAAPGSLQDRSAMDRHLASIFDAIDGGAYERRGRHRNWDPDHPEDEPSPPLSSDEDESDDGGPPGSEDEYGGSFIDDGEIGDEGSGYGDVTMFSDEDEEEELGLSEGEHTATRRGRSQRGGPPPRVRRVQSDNSDEEHNNDNDVEDQPVFTRMSRRRNAPIVVSDSE